MKKLLPLVCALLALQNSFALEQDKPAACPDISVIASVGVNTPVDYKGLWFATKEKHDYGTPQLWSFVVMTKFDVSEVSGEQAVAEANANITTLSSVVGPSYSQADKAWACVYADGDSFDYMGMAITPPTKIPTQMDVVKYHFAKR